MLTNSWHHHHCESRLYHEELLREAAQRRRAGRWQTHPLGGLRALVRALWRGAQVLFAERGAVRTARPQRQ